MVGGRPGFAGAHSVFPGQRFLGPVAGGAVMRSVGWGGYGGGWGGYSGPGYAWGGYGWRGYDWPGYGWGPGIAWLAFGLGLASAYYAFPPTAFGYPYYASPFYGLAYPLYDCGGYGCCSWGSNNWGLGLAGLALGLGLISAFPGYSPLAYSYPLYASPFFGAPYPLYGYGLPVAYAPTPAYGFGPLYGFGYESVAYDVPPVSAVPYGLPLW